MLKTIHLRKETAAIFIITAAVIAVLAVSLLSAASSYAASGAPKLSKTRLRIRSGGSAVLRIKGISKKMKLTSKNVKWSVSGKKLVKVSVKGKKKQKAVIRAGNRTGVCYVKVKAGKKTLKCRVRVYKQLSDDDEFKERPLSSDSENKTSSFTAGAAVERKADDTFRSAFADTSLKLLKLAYKEKSGNVLISPDSIFTAMSMTEAGAAGKTLSEMEAAFGGISSEAYAEYLSTMNSRLTGAKGIKYHIADSIWYRKGLMECKKPFLQKNVDLFRSEIYAAPFGDSTVSDINNWVYNNTRGMIPSILDSLRPEDMLVLINAIAFEGTWADPYLDGQIAPGTFTRTDGSASTNVNMLSGTEHTYVEICGAEGFIKPYAGGELAFLGLETPDGMTADEYLSRLTGADFIKGYDSRRTENIVVMTLIPEFKYDYDIRLVGAMHALGIHDAFDPEAANFSELSESPVFIGDIVHKTHIELDRNGTKAAAVTAVIAKNSAIRTDPPEVKEVRLDHPFIYAIVDCNTGLPLFIGVVNTVG